ncbi:MAG: hypothetical protein HZB33_08495 [Nitrospirae bacterium]|nr:hypothetical protein [Nitrospirota bacterium]
MKTIEIDDDVFNFLKLKAEPFIDTPNTVLRRILLPKESSRGLSSTHSHDIEPRCVSQTTKEAFMHAYLKRRYPESFRVRSPYRTMFESEKRIVYFQNFNKQGAVNLWYRLSGKILEMLAEAKKPVFICFTNPADGVVYDIPLSDILSQSKKVNWNRADIEANIDTSNGRWRDLDWNINEYLDKHTAQ